MVADLTNAKYGANATVDYIKAAISQKVSEYVVPHLLTLSGNDTFNKQKKTIGLQEVDSPLFLEYFKKYSIIVSPSMQPFASAYESVASELKEVTTQKETLTATNSQLEAKVSSLTQEKTSLEKQLQSSASTYESKYKTEINKLKENLRQVKEERDSLQDIIDKDSSTFKDISRLTAGRFREGGEIGTSEPTSKKSKTNKMPLWVNWLNSVLLIIVTVLCIIVLLAVLKTKDSADSTDSQEKETSYSSEQVANYREYNSNEEVADIKEAEQEIQENPEMQYSKPEECTINIKGGGDTVKQGKVLSFEVCLNDGTYRPAVVPEGHFQIDLGNTEGPIDIATASYTVPGNQSEGTKIRIIYKVDGKTFTSRVTTIVK